MSAFALIAVDVQRDFLEGGALEAPGASRVLTPLVHLARHAELVVCSRDWHPSHHFSFSDDPQFVDGSWPPHCVQKTRGARIHPSISRYADYVISKGMDPKGPDQYSAFALGAKTLRPVETLEEILARSPIDTVVIGGLILELCVAFTAFDANALGYKTVVPLDSTAWLTEGAMAVTLQVFENAGIEVVDHYDP